MIFFKGLFWFTLLFNVVGALGLVSRPLSTITRLLLPAPKGQQGSRTLEGKRVCSELSSFRLQSRLRVMIIWSGPLCLLTCDTYHLKAVFFFNSACSFTEICREVMLTLCQFAEVLWVTTRERMVKVVIGFGFKVEKPETVFLLLWGNLLLLLIVHLFGFKVLRFLLWK